MSISSLPEWKQLLLDRKRKGEEARQRREREEEERLANMPAWKREVIQRRRAKHEGFTSLQTSDGRVIAETMSEQGLRNGAELQSQVSVENIGPVRHNPFILSQSVWRGNRSESQEEQGSDSRTEWGGGVRKAGEGCLWNKEKQRMLEGERHGCEGKKNQAVILERAGDEYGCRERQKLSNGERERTGQHPDTMHLGNPASRPCLRTVQAEYGISGKEISDTEKEEQRNKIREVELEAKQEKKKERKTMRHMVEAEGEMSEIKASAVLTIKPLARAKERSEAHQRFYSRREEGKPWTRSDEEMDEKPEWGEKEGAPGMEHDRSRMKVGRIWPKVQVSSSKTQGEVNCSVRRDMRESSLGEGGPAEGSGRVSQLRSKFGEHHKPPLRSKSTDCFVSHDGNGRKENAGEEPTLGGRETRTPRNEEVEEAEDETLRPVFKQSSSFSECVVSTMENRVDDEDSTEEVLLEQKYSDKGALWTEGCWESRASPKEDEWENSEMEHQGCQQVSVQGGPWIAKEMGHGGETVYKDSEVGGTPGGEGPRDTGNVAAMAKGLEASAALPNKDVAMTMGRNEKRKDKTERERLGAAPEMTMKGKVAVHEEEERAPAVRRKELPHCNFNTVEEIGGQGFLREVGLKNEPAFTERASSRCSGFVKPARQVDLFSRPLERQCRERKAECGNESRAATATHSYIHMGSDGNADIALRSSHADGGWIREVDLTKMESDGVRLDEAVASTLDSSEPGCAAVTEVLIPRTCFYKGGRGSRSCVEREGRRECGKLSKQRDSLEVGRPLICFELLQERIGQKGLEGVMESEEECRVCLENRCKEHVTHEENIDGKDRKMLEDEKMELERVLRVREVSEKRDVSTEGKENIKSEENQRAGKIQRRPWSSTSTSLDVRQEADVSEPNPQLPASASPLLLAAEAEARATTAAAPAVFPSLLHTHEKREEKGQHVENSECDQQGRRITEGGKEEKEEEELLEEDYHPPNRSPSLIISSGISPSFSSPPLPSVISMSRIYNLKPVVSRSSLPFGERKTEQMSPTLQAQGRERPSQSYRSPVTQDSPQHKGETLEQQSLPRMELKPPWWQVGHRKTQEGTAPRGEKAQKETTDTLTVQQQVEMLKLEVEHQSPGKAPNQKPFKVNSVEQKESSKLSQLVQHYQKLDQGMCPKDQDPSNEKMPMQQPLNQCLPSRSFTINPKCGPALENPPQNQECKDTATPSASLSSSSSATPSSLPLFSLRTASAVQGKRGNTITIVPKRGGKPTTDPGANRTVPQAQTPAPGDASKKRYPTVEEIVVLGGYQKLEKSCMVKHGKTPKGVKVRFDETQLEQVCEYPSESSMLALLPDLLSDSEKGAEEKTEGQEEEEEEEEETGAFALSSRRADTGKGRVLRVDESCRR